MTVSDPIGDMLTRIRNGQSAHPTVLIPSSKFKKFILDLNKKKGFISSYEPIKEKETSLNL